MNIPPVTSSSGRRIAYVSYDGLEDPLGRSQVLPYVEGLAGRGHAFELITFEKPGVRLRLREPIGNNVHWTALRYHRTPTVPATAVDIVQGAALVALAGIFRNVDLVHVRSYVPAVLALPWALASSTPFLFDMRGMWPDEKVDAGAWSADGGLYRATKRVERLLLRQAGAITVLTHSMRRYLREEYAYRNEIAASISVIPTCTDLDTFYPDVEPDAETLQRLGDSSRVLVYVGSLGAWYMSEEMARFYLAWRRAVSPAPARLLLVTRDEPSVIARVLADAGAEGEIVHVPARRDQVPHLIQCAHASVCFIRPTFSKRGSAPTKLGEILACGLPVAANIVGDMAEILAGSQAGVVIEDMSDAQLAEAAVELARRAEHREATRVAARDLATRWFSLARALESYDRIYTKPASRWRVGASGDAGWP